MKNLSKTTLLTLLLIVPCILFSQFEAQKWYFGYNAGLDFSTNPPTVLTNGAMRTDEGSASISDAAGNLLFYTDGITVYNKVHTVMANGTGLMGNTSTTQSAIIVKRPGSISIYYVFTLDQSAAANGLRYSEVDLALASGMGSVTVKNYSLYTPSCEKMTAIRHCNGADVWVVTHDWSSADFRTYLVTAAGVSLTPVVSTSGASVIGNNQRTYGQMKVSPNGKKLGLTIYDGSPAPVELHDFNALTGVVSNGFSLNSSTSNYGCEFSPDGTKFYSGRVTVPELFQWDLCAGTNSAIVASKVTFTTSNDFTGSFQLAPDGKIYIARMYVPFISSISFPNLAGAACNFTNLAISLGTDTSMLGLPNFINSFFKPLPQAFTFTNTICSTFSFNTAPASTLNASCGASTNSITGFSWNFGDPASGSANTSTLTNPSHTYPTASSYTAQLVISYECSTDTVRATLVPLNASPNMSVAGTYTICKGDKRLFTASGASTYTWSTGPNTTTISLSPTVTTTYSVIGTATNSCKNNKVFTITVNKCTGQEEESSDTFLKIYPNPSKGIFNVETDKTIKLVVSNSLGQIILEKTFDTGVYTLDISNYGDGIYFVKSTSPKGSKIVRLIKTE